MFSWRSCSRTWTAQAVGYKFSMLHSHVKPSLWPSCHWDISLKSHVKKTTNIKLEHATYTFYFLYHVKFPPGISHFSFLVTIETAPPPPLSLHLNNDWGMTEFIYPFMTCKSDPNYFLLITLQLHVYRHTWNRRGWKSFFCSSKQFQASILIYFS